MPRNTDLPPLLKRKAIAYMVSEKRGWTEQRREEELAKALPIALTGSTIDERYRYWLCKQEKVQVTAFNMVAAGYAIRKRGWFNKLVYGVGFRKTANKWWLARAESILPTPK